MISIYFGSPGAGKTTFAVRLAEEHNRNVRNALKRKRMPKTKYEGIFANFDTKSAIRCSLDNLGTWTFPPRSHVLIDEAGITYNNRKFKTLSQQQIEWFKLHRHYRCDVSMFSQALDIDITMMRLADRYYHMRKLGPFTLVRRIKKFVTIDENTKQIIDGYEFFPIWWRFIPFIGVKDACRLCFRPRYYRFFDSYATPPTPIRDFVDGLRGSNVAHCKR